VVAPVKEVEGVDHVSEISFARRGFPDPDQAFGLGIRQRSEKDGVDDAENRGVGADADSERDDGDGGEAEVRAQGAEGVPEVLKERVHGST